MNKVLGAVLSLHRVLLSEPTPVPDDCIDHRWKWFKGCLGTLDDTHINVLVSNSGKQRYRTRKGTIATNTLALCDRNMQFVYFLPSWEGSAGDSRVLRDAVARPNGLRVPQGCYYLCDNDYANSNGFLTPYKGVRYHLKEWGIGNAQPQNPKELFNMRHNKARNVIERAFAVLKMRWGILHNCNGRRHTRMQMWQGEDGVAPCGENDYQCRTLLLQMSRQTHPCWIISVVRRGCPGAGTGR
ncbi:uncharacterized protein LOC121750708 isoform X3 [Salvia splendens]|uniref:uncharacterized protein LOC121750708 isoform X3 n=1 Tax=Salvia splendens TaxID=180675 RepID=UPI001C275B85|nr:uncharacterized protein LOC121750708 isoform X3 [Salvia splendens]